MSTSCEQPEITVVIPTYNGAEFIDRAIESVFSQKVERLEVLVVDDGSTDNTQEVLGKYKDEPRFLCVKHEINRSLGAARNTGMLHANGEYLFYLDSDDWMDENTLEHMLGVARETGAEVVACGIQTVDSNFETEPYHAWEFTCEGGLAGVEMFSEYKIGSPAWNKLYLLKFVKDGNIRFIEKYYHEDISFSAYVALNCCKYVSLDNLYINYYQHGDSLTNRIPREHHLLSYFNVYLQIHEYCETLKKRNVGDEALYSKLFTNYCYNEVYPKLERYARTRTRSQFEHEVKQAALEMFGLSGHVVGDMVKALFGELAQEG